MSMYNESQEIKFSIGANVYTATEAPDGQSMTNIAGNTVLVFASVGVANAGTLALTVQHNDIAADDDAGWSNVPPSALINADGEADTFDAVTSTGGNQVLYLVRERLKPYVRVVATIGSSGQYDLCAGFVGHKRYN